MTTEQANALYNRQMDAARARAIEARREAVNEFWDSLGLTAAGRAACRTPADQPGLGFQHRRRRGGAGSQQA